MYFSDEDSKAIESLKYDKSLKPRFNQMRPGLFWKDEWPGLSRDGEHKLAYLFIARFFIYHSGLSEEEWWIPDKDFFKDAWKSAVESGLKWPGFEKCRLYLSEADKKFLADELKALSELTEM